VRSELGTMKGGATSRLKGLITTLLTICSCSVLLASDENTANARAGLPKVNDGRGIAIRPLALYTQNVLGRASGRLRLDSGRAPDGSFLVRTGERQSGFGPFTESLDGSESGADRLRAAFGPPTRSGDVSERSCELIWSDLGIRASLAAFGSTHNPCRNGTFTEAILTDKRWHTPDGVRIGSSKRKAKRKSIHTCDSTKFTGGIYCPTTGYVFGTHRTDCAQGRSPNVMAHTSRRRVLTLLVFWHSCE
jgi:hypothetical protein